MVRGSSHAEIENFQVKFRGVKRKKASFMKKFVNSPRFLAIFPFNGLSTSIGNIYVKYMSVSLKSVCNFHG